MNYPDKIKCLAVLDEIERIADTWNDTHIDKRISSLRTVLREGFHATAYSTWQPRIKLPWERAIYAVPSVPSGGFP